MPTGKRGRRRRPEMELTGALKHHLLTGSSMATLTGMTPDYDSSPEALAEAWASYGAEVTATYRPRPFQDPKPWGYWAFEASESELAQRAADQARQAAASQAGQAAYLAVCHAGGSVDAAQLAFREARDNSDNSPHAAPVAS